jgi:hypothetical protein
MLLTATVTAQDSILRARVDFPRAAGIRERSTLGAYDLDDMTFPVACFGIVAC